MSIPPNIDRFNKATLIVFDLLYQNFPVPIDLNASNIAMETLPVDETFEESFNSIQPVYFAIEFLRKEGFIDCGNKTLDGTKFLQVVLTSKSLAVLGRTPSTLEPHVSVSDKVRSVVKGGIKEASSEAAKKVIELLFSNASSLVSIGQVIAS